MISKKWNAHSLGEAICLTSCINCSSLNYKKCKCREKFKNFLKHELVNIIQIHVTKGVEYLYKIKRVLMWLFGFISWFRKKLHFDNFRANTEHDGQSRALVKYRFKIFKKLFSIFFQLCMCLFAFVCMCVIDNVLILSV